MKKVVVLNSPVFEKHYPSTNEDYLPPIGLGLIVSALMIKYDVKFIDSLAEKLEIDEIIELIGKMKVKYVCVNIFTTNYNLVRKIVESSNKNIRWIIGGLSTKSLYKEIFGWKTECHIDIVYGDGESIVESLIESNVTEIPFDTARQRRFFIISPISKYYVKEISKEVLNRSIFEFEPQINIFGDSEASIYTSRGCPYNCAYCVAARKRNLELGSIRRKDANSIIAELEIIKEIYPQVKAIRVLDDLFLSDIISFVDAANIFSNFPFSWRAMCHIKSIVKVNDQLLKNIANSGCNELFIGIESGSPSILKKIRKTYDLEIIKTSIYRVLMAGINIKGYFICGFPNETLENLEETFDLANTLTDIAEKMQVKFRNSTFQFRPYFGTELYEEIVKCSGIQKNSILTSMKSSEKLNIEVRNKSFNFDCGNYSSVDDDVLNEYIKKMNSLNAKCP